MTTPPHTDSAEKRARECLIAHLQEAHPYSSIVFGDMSQTDINACIKAILAFHKAEASRSDSAEQAARDMRERAADILKQRVIGFASRFNSIYNGRIVAEELAANIQAILALPLTKEGGT